jgi:DNA-binding response OmpR family regulator
VITSACDEPGCVLAAHAQGASYYLMKPFQDDDLRAAIDLTWHRHCQATLARLHNRPVVQPVLQSA